MSKPSVDIRNNGTYRVRVRVNIDGEIISTSATYWPQPNLTSEQNRKAAEKRGYKLIEEVKAKHQAELEGKEITFEKYYESRYLEKAKTYYAGTTFPFYVNTIKKLFLKDFGGKKIKDINKKMVQDLIQELANKANENEDLDDPVCIKPQTVKRYITVFRSVIAFALEDGIIEGDPFVGGFRYKKVMPTNVTCLDDRDFDAILTDLNMKMRSKDLELERNDIIVAIGMLAGLRRGELVALRWQDIENLNEDTLDRVRINVNCSAYKPKGEPQVIDSTKTPAGVRAFTVPLVLGEVLWSWKQSLEKKREVKKENFIISDEFGDMVSVYSPTRWFKEYLEEHHLKDVKLHSLRHTFASMMLEKGMDIGTLMKLMGHTSIETTEIYVHSFKMKHSNLMAKINKHTTKLLSSKGDEDEGGDKDED